jgi:hypothetical protein
MKDFVDLVLTQRIFNSGLNFLTDVLQRVALDVLGLALGMSLWAALANFGALSNLFRKEGAAGLRGKESVFQAGLVFGLLPLALLAWLAIKAGVSHVLMVYGSGLTLIPPIFHVWLEIKCRGPTEDTA